MEYRVQEQWIPQHQSTQLEGKRNANYNLLFQLFYHSKETQGTIMVRWCGLWQLMEEQS